MHHTLRFARIGRAGAPTRQQVLSLWPPERVEGSLGVKGRGALLVNKVRARLVGTPCVISRAAEQPTRRALFGEARRGAAGAGCTHCRARYMRGQKRKARR